MLLESVNSALKRVEELLNDINNRSVCSTKEQVNQVLKLWTTFLEPMLYVPSRPENSDNVEDVEISTRGATRNEGESDGSLGADSVTFNNVKCDNRGLSRVAYTFRL
ncbi:hypothetical protein Tco_1087232 [Tanacetum coccineum]